MVNFPSYCIVLLRMIIALSLFSAVLCPALQGIKEESSKNCLAFPCRVDTVQVECYRNQFFDPFFFLPETVVRVIYCWYPLSIRGW